MQDQIEEMFKVNQREGQKISLSKLRHKPREQKIDEQAINRIEKLKKFAIQDVSIPTQKLNSYYCSLCGQINLVTNIYLETMPKRSTDGSIAIDLRSNFVKPHLQRQRIKHIKRDDGVEIQYRLRCECGIPVAYTCIAYDQFENTRQNQDLKPSNRPFIYFFEGALTEKMKESKLISELITYKETILLHLKKKIAKK